jgi:BioD-like phosphotransacetylase family protein
MLPKILSQDSNYDEWCEQAILNAYQEAAECDEFMFGDHDYCNEWLGANEYIEEE